MLDISLLQLGAYGSMGALALTATYRIAGAFDCLLMLRRQRIPARRLCAALATIDQDQRARRVQDAVEALHQAPEPAARFFLDIRRPDNAQTSADERAAAAQARLVEAIERQIVPHRHRLARLGSVAGPMGLGFTVLALIVYLVGTRSGTGVGDGLLQALPVALGTTGIACFTIVALKIAASLLLQRADETIAALHEAGRAWLAASRPRIAAISPRQEDVQ